MLIMSHSRRLIASEDPGTRIAAQVMLLNCIASDSEGASERREVHGIDHAQRIARLLTLLSNDQTSLDPASSRNQPYLRLAELGTLTRGCRR